jgi:hypothetical protein
MDGHQHERVNDDTLAREIEAALGVDPSPEFLPKVRARIANERMRQGWLASAPWRWAGAVAVVTAVAIIGLWTLREPAPAPREVHVTPPVEMPPPPVEPARPAPVPVASSTERHKPVSAPVVRTVRATQSPDAVAPFEVVISPDESAALQQLFVLINSRRIETRVLPDLATALKPPDPIEEIVLDPITISPLAALEGE